MILDLFAGPGGWSEGLRSIGLTDVGVEWDESACRTRIAAGHPTIRADVERLPLALAKLDVTGLIASPPCQDFSTAGKNAGRGGDRGRLIDLVPPLVEQLRPEWVACEQVPPALGIWKEHAHYYRELGYSVWCGVLNSANYGVPQTRERAYLMASRVAVATPPEPTHAKNPMPGLFGPELEPWVSMAEALGWGTPARPYWTVAPGVTEGGGADSQLLGGASTRSAFREHMERDDWVVRTGANSQCGPRSAANNGIEPYERSIDRPAPTVDSKVGHWVVQTGVNTETTGGRERYERDVEQPAPTMTSRGDNWRWLQSSNGNGSDHRKNHPDPSNPTGRNRRPIDKPAQTIDANVGAFRWFDRRQDYAHGGVRAIPQTEPAPTLNGLAKGVAVWREGEEEPKRTTATIDRSYAITIEEALVLQGFRPDYPVQGKKTKRYEQIGNAVVPRMAAVVVAALTGRDASPK